MENGSEKNKKARYVTFRRCLAIFMAVIMLMSSFGGTLGAFAAFGGQVLFDGYYGEDITWGLYDDGKLVISGEGSIKDYSEPADDGNTWMDVKDMITSVVIEDGITSIGDVAFFGIDSITSLEIADSVTYIGNNAFQGCSIEYLELPSELTEMGEAAFAENPISGELVIPEGVTYISSHCFMGTNITVLRCLSDIDTVVNSAFYNCTELTEIYFENVECIDTSAFEGCGSLNDIYYNGYISDWYAVSVQNYNEAILNATVHCIDGDITLNNAGDNDNCGDDCDDGNCGNDNNNNCGNEDNNGCGNDYDNGNNDGCGDDWNPDYDDGCGDDWNPDYDDGCGDDWNPDYDDGCGDDWNPDYDDDYEGSSGSDISSIDIYAGDTHNIDSKQIVYYKFVPEKDGAYRFYSESDSDPVYELLDYNYDVLESNDDNNGHQFDYTYYHFKAGRTYYLKVSFCSFDSYCNVTLEYVKTPSSIVFEPSEEYVLTEGLSSGHYDTRYFWDEENGEELSEKYYRFNLPSYNTGDTLTVNYDDEETVDYIYDGCSGDFVSEDGDIIKINASSEQSSNPWVENGSYNYFTVEYNGATYIVPVTIISSPVAEIEFEPAEEYVLYEGLSDGYYNSYEYWDEYLDEWVEEKYYLFYLPAYNEGDKLIVYMNDGTSVEYVYTYDYSSSDCCGGSFVSESGEKLYLDKDHNQYSAPWKVDGKNNYFTVESFGLEINVPVTILPNPIESIEFSPAEEYILTEGFSDGYYTENEIWSEEDEEYYYEEYYRFHYPSYNDGDTFTVNMTDGSHVDYIYDDSSCNFISESGETIYFSRSHNQSSNHWVEGGKYNYFTISYAGLSVIVPVTIKANPVASVEYTPFEEYELTEGFSDGYYRTDSNGDDWYYYYLPHYREGDIVTLYMNDGTSVDYVYTQGDSWDDCSDDFFSADGKRLEICRDHNQYSNHWVEDGKYNHFTVKCYGATAIVPVNVYSNPVESFEFIPTDEYVFTEGFSDGYYREDWIYEDGDECCGDGEYIEYYFYYLPSYKDGDKFVVYKTDGTSVEYIYNSDIGDFISDSGETVYFSRDNYQYDKPWKEDGKNNYYVITYAGKKCNVPVTVKSSPVEAIEFEPAREYIFTEGFSYGYYSEDYYGDEYYEYYLPSFEDGDKLTVYLDDGTSKEYIYTASNSWDDCGSQFVSDDGNTLKAYMYAEQYRYPWSQDGENNYITVKCHGVTVNVPVTIIANPVDDIKFSPAEEEYVLTEGFSDGYYRTRWEWDEDTCEDIRVKYYYYYYPAYKDGDTFTVYGTDGSVTEYVYNKDIDSFISESDETVYFDRTNDQTSRPWEEDGDYNYFTVIYAGKTYNVPVTIRPNPVAGIEFTPVEEYVFTEGFSDGCYTYRWIWDSYQEEEIRDDYYCYYLPSYRDGDKLTVYMYDGTSVEYTYITGNSWDECGGYFVDPDGKQVYLDRDENQYNEHWYEGGENNYFTISCYGITEKVYVTVNDNPVSSVEFTPLNEIVLTEGFSAGYYSTRYWYDHSEEYSERYYYYYLPGYCDGDVFTVNKTDGTSVSYVYSNEEFVSADGENIYFDIYSDQESNPWIENGEYNHFTVRYAGKAYNVPVTIKANPVEAIEFTPVTPYELTEGFSNGYYTTDWNDNEYYEYYVPSFADGDKLTVYMNDGTSVDYIYAIGNSWDDCGGYFVAPDGTQISVSRYDEQGEYHWVEDGEYNYFTIRCYGVTAEVPVTVYSNPVESIDFVPYTEYILTEGFSGGWYDRNWFCDDDSCDEYYVEYYRYYLPELVDGDKLIVYMNNGTVVEYIYNRDNYEFISESGDAISHVSFNDEQYNRPWVENGEYNYFTASYAGRKCTVPVTIKSNPVAAIDFTPVAPCEFTEGLSDGCYTSDEDGNEYYEYYLPSYKDGDKLTVYMNDGSSVDYIYSSGNSWDDCSGYFIAPDGTQVRLDRINYQHDKHWTENSENNYFEIKCYGVTAEVPVTVYANPVESIEVELVDEFVLTEGISDGYYDESWVWNDETDDEEYEEYYRYYIPSFRDGDKVIVNKTDGTIEIYTYNEEISDFVSDSGDVIYIGTNHNQYSYHWVEDGEYNYFTASYAGRKYNVPVTIKANPIASIEIELVEDFVLTEAISDGYYNECWEWDGELEQDVMVDKYYDFNIPAFRTGDKLVVNMVNGSSTDYIYNADVGEFISESGEKIALESSANQYDRHWVEGGEYNYFTVSYAYKTFNVPVTIKANPVKAIEFKPAVPYELSEGMSGGYYNTDDYGNEYYQYYIPSYENGDKLIVHMKDNTKVEYTCYYDEYYEDVWFVSADGMKVYPERYTNQYEQHWVENGENNYFTLECFGVSVTVPVTVKPNPVVSIEFNPVGEIILTEGFSSGYYENDWFWDDELGEDVYVEYYYYHTPNFRDGDELIVNLANGKSVVYTFDYEEWVFISENGDSIDPSTDEEQWRNPWIEDGNYNYFYVEYSGRKSAVPVTIKSNPVESISFIPIEEIVLIEGISDGYLYSELDEEYYYYYIPDNRDGDIFRVNYTDGSVVDYIYDSEKQEFRSASGDVVEIGNNSDQHDYHWTVDGEYNYYTIEYGRRYATVPVTVKANSVVSFEFVPLKAYELIEGISQGYYTDDENDNRYYDYDFPKFVEGDKIIAYLEDDSTVEYMYTTYVSDDGYSYGLFVSADGQEITTTRDSDQYYNHWTPNGEYNYFMLSCFGKKINVPVSVKPNPVESFDIVPVSPYEFIEGESEGYYITENGETWYKYTYIHYCFNEGDKIIAKLNDGSTVEYVYTRHGDFDWSYYFVNSNGDRLYYNVYDTQYDHHWVIGGEYNYFELSCFGHRIHVPVSIVCEHKNTTAFTEKAPTCTESGCTNGIYCNDCKTWVEGNVIDALEHDIIKHNAKAATCGDKGWNAYETCSRCDYTTYKEISATGKHTGGTATCTTKAKCTVCGTYYGSLANHNYAAATCSAPKTCKVCKATTGSANGHKFDNNCDTTCNNCTYTRTTSHTGGTATCTAKAKCSVCGTYFGSLASHNYAAATCSAPKTCKVCKATTGSANGHKFDNNCDTTCNNCTYTRTTSHTGGTATCTAKAKCSVCGKSYGSTKAHDTSTTTTKATLKKNGKVVTKCNDCGEVTKTKTVYYPKTIKLSYTSATYNGKTKSPKVIVKDSKGNELKKGTDYTVKYESGRKNPGKYTVTVTFKGKYKGEKKLTFTISTKAPSLKTLKSATKGKVTFTWSNVEAETGYQVYYSTKKSSGYKKVKSYKKDVTKGSFSSLKSGKTYYFKVRAYKKVSGTTIYSDWSAVKSIKVK